MYKRLFLLVGIALLAVLLWSLSGKGTNTSYAEAREMLLYRRIGHEFLLSAGDSRSRVLPVKKIATGAFRIEFENPFAFRTDSLVAIVERVLNRKQYIVEVTNVDSREVVYSFAFPSKKEDVPCLGRMQVAGRYAVNILTDTPGSKQFSSLLFISLVLASALITISFAFFGRRFSRGKNVVAPREEAAEPTSFIPLGKFRFYPAQHRLQLDNTSTELTAKETRLLRIFSDAPNEVIDRNRLLKEGWEDEGVITGRSLDMFVSKLRKKLQADPAVSIINVHGKGYRLNC